MQDKFNDVTKKEEDSIFRKISVINEEVNAYKSMNNSNLKTEKGNFNENTSSESSSRENITEKKNKKGRYNICNKLKKMYKASKMKKFVCNTINAGINVNFRVNFKNKIKFPKIQNNNIIKNNNMIYENNENDSKNNESTNKNNNNDEPIKKKCNCKNTNCLKFYCECFSNGKYCEDCFCCDCKNTEEFEKLRTEKYNEKMSIDPNFMTRINSNKKSWTCHCKNSNCIKNYCDCFHNGKTCNSKCKCIECHNKSILKLNKNIKKLKIIKRIRGIKTGRRGRKKKIEKIILSPQKLNGGIKKAFNILYQSTADMTIKAREKKRESGIHYNTELNKNIFQKLNMDNV